MGRTSAILVGVLAAAAAGQPKTPAEKIIAAAVERDAAAVRKLLDADPRLIEAVVTVPPVAYLLASPWWPEGRDKPPARLAPGATLLHIAAGNGDEELTGLLLGRGAKLGPAPFDGASPLHYAARWGHNEVAALLLAKGAAIEARSRDGLTPLALAAEAGRAEAVRFLLARGAKLDVFSAIHLGLADRVAKLLDAEAGLIASRDARGLTPLHLAARRGSAAILKLLLGRGADVTAGRHGRTPLACAVEGDHVEAMEVLLGAGADVNQARLYGDPLLYYAGRSGRTELVKLLVAHRADLEALSAQCRGTALFAAATAGHKHIVELLLSKGADITGGSAGGNLCPLREVVWRGNEEMAALLIARGAALDVFSAAGLGRADRLRAILRADAAKTDAVDPDHGLPLSWAAQHNRLECAKLLLQAGAEVNARGGFHGRAALHHAAAEGHCDMIRLLLEHGAYVNIRSRHAKDTPLHWAVSRPGNAPAVKLLLAGGANPNAIGACQPTGEGGRPPVVLARAQRSEGIVALLVSHPSSRGGTFPAAINSVGENVRAIRLGDRTARVDWLLYADTTRQGAAWYLRRLPSGDEQHVGTNLSARREVDELRASPDGSCLAVLSLRMAIQGEAVVEVVDLPKLLLEKKYLVRWKVEAPGERDHLRIVGRQDGRLVLQSRLLLTGADAKGRVHPSLRMEPPQTFALSVEAGKLEAISPAARDPAAYYVKRLAGPVGRHDPREALLVLRAVAAIPALTDLLGRTKDPSARARIQRAIDDLRALQPTSEP